MTPSLRSLAALSPAILALATAPAVAQDYFDPVGSEFVVTAGTNYQQIWSKVATDPGGTFLAYAWTQGQDPWLRLLEIDGSPRTGGIHCNPTLNTYIQDEPAVSVDANGHVLVAWSDRNAYDGEIMGIFGSVYDMTGAPVNLEVQINVEWQASQWRPLIRPMPGGGFIVAWSGQWDGEAFFRILDTNGVPVTGDVQVNTHENGAQVDTAPAVAPDGTLFVAYVDYSGFGGVGTGTNVWGRVFTSAGAPLTPVFHVSEGMSFDDQREPRVVSNDQGDFFVVWEDKVNDGSGWGIFGRIYDSAGNPVTGVFQVNPTSAGAQRTPDVASISNGQFVVVWDDTKSGNSDVVARRFDALGTPLGEEIQVNGPSTGGAQFRPSVTASENGRMVAFGWEGDGNVVDAFGRVFARTPAPATYCSGKTTSLGQVPFIGSSGSQPSAALYNASPFRLTATRLVPDQVTFLLYGYQKSSLDFHGGKLCIKSPFERVFPAKTASSGGTVLRNFNSVIASGNDPMLTVGQVVTAQFRQRDPGNTIGGFQDNLTDAIRFTITP